MLKALRSVVRHRRVLTGKIIRYSTTSQEFSESLYDALLGQPVSNAFIALENVPGKGRALVAASPLEPGDLILVSDPIAAVFGEADNMPSPDLLVELLETSKFSSDDVAEIQTMHGAGSGPVPNFQNVVAFNAFGDDFEDLAIAEVAGQEARSFVGLWPTFALLNHSCVPNCIHYTSNGYVRVRAARPIQPGEELTISYLGREDFSPLEERGKLIQDRYHFQCGCLRCRTERSLPAPVRRKLTDIYFDMTYHLTPKFTEVVSDPKPEALKSISAAISKHHAQLFDLLAPLENATASATGAIQSVPSQSSPTSHTSNQTQSSTTPTPGGVVPIETLVDLRPITVASAAVYELLETRYLLQELSGESSREQLRACWDVNRQLGPGSELQIFQACRLLRESLRAKDEPKDGPRVMGDAEALRSAVRIRYGALSAAQLANFTKLVSKIGAAFV